MENVNQPKNPTTSLIGGGHSLTPTKAEKAENISKFNDELGQALRTLRMLEERYSTIRSKIQVSDQNIIEDTNKIFMQLKLIVKDITDLKIKIEDMRIKLNTFSNEIDEMASKQELKVLQRYVELWEPMQFITEKQAIELIREGFKQLKEREVNKK